MAAEVSEVSGLLDALPIPVAHALQAGQPVAVGGALVGARSCTPPTVRQKDPASGAALEGGAGAVRRWLALYDRATWLMGEPDPHDPRPQRTASKAIDSLFRYEHQMTPRARRNAREALWQRDRPGEPLPTTVPHATHKGPAGCHCTQCRAGWERCRCTACRLARLLNRPAPSA
jgi:hypothetical protein